ncbi:response regulator [Cohnella suwonensis]|uniref:Response regulator n=1 Tax=Cohnella suwonensis TaxID=696072 RepID=A0ABW0M0X3_9BACL
MLRVIIVEDEEPILDLMERLVGRHPMLEVAGAFTSPIEALERYSQLKPDAAFLDIEMPKMGGIELAEKLKAIDEELQVVFTTAYPGYAVDAFRVSAVDYLLKPVTPDDLERVAGRLSKNHSLRAGNREPAEEAVPSVRCFGTFETRGAGGGMVNWPTRKTEELFAYLLAYPNRLVNKWQLSDLLWPDLDEERGLHNVHNTVYRLKKALKAAGFSLELGSTNEGYHLASGAEFSDFGRLREFLGRSAKIDGRNAAEAKKLQLSCRGTLFGGKDYAWSAGIAAEASAQQATLARMLAAWHRGQGDLASAKDVLSLYLGHELLDEEMNAELLRLCAESGDAAAFCRHYESYRRLLEDELGIAPSAAMRELAASMSR